MLEQQHNLDANKLLHAKDNISLGNLLKDI